VLHLPPLLEYDFQDALELMLLDEAGELDYAVSRDTDGSVHYGNLVGNRDDERALGETDRARSDVV
jgi:hypothetical protein